MVGGLVGEKVRRGDVSHPGFALGVGKKKVGDGGLTWVNAQVLFK